MLWLASGDALHLHHHQVMLWLASGDALTSPSYDLDLHQVMLWLDQSPLAPNVIEKAYDKLLNHEFQPLFINIREDRLRRKYVRLPEWLNDQKPLKPFNPNHAPCTVWPLQIEDISTGDPDLRVQSDREQALEKMKVIALLFCKCAEQSFKKREDEVPRKFITEMCERALFIERFIDFGPWPVEIEHHIALAEAAYTKALCLDFDLDSFVCGVEEMSLFRLGFGEEIEEGRNDVLPLRI